MYRLDLKERLPDGKSGALLTQCWYPTKTSAEAAKKAFNKLSYTKYKLVPICAESSHKSGISTLYNYNVHIVEE